MSCFIDRLNQISRVVPPSMGFGRTKSTPEKPKILLIASLEQIGPADYLTGADAGLLRISKPNPGIKALKEMSQATPDIPWGCWLTNTVQRGINQIVKADCDFVVFPAATTPLAPLPDEEMGKILELEVSLSEGLLRTVNELPVDAVLLAGKQTGGHPLTWLHLMLCQRLAALLTKPLLISTPPNIGAAELRVLWEAGVDGVVIEVGAGQSENGLKAIRQVIDKMDFPSQRKRGETEALLPHISRSGNRTPIEEEEE